MGPLNGNGRNRLVAEINVTPLVDVMLVLLIIFMITAPMMTQGVDVDLPETTAESLRQEEDPLVITIDKDGKISINEERFIPRVLQAELAKLPAEVKDRPIYLRADTSVEYGRVVSVMADIKKAGFSKLGMITQPSLAKQ